MRQLRLAEMTALGVAGLLGACSLGPSPGGTPTSDAGANPDASSGGDGPGGGGRPSVNGGTAGSGPGGGTSGATNGGVGGTGAGGRDDLDASTDAAGDGAPDADVDDGTAIGVLGHACSLEDALACAGHAQNALLVCRSGHWADNGSCNAGDHCQSARGGFAGTCLPILPECTGKADGTPICRDTRPDVCGPDGVNADDPGVAYKKCKYACIDGRCAGPSCGGGLPSTCGANGDESCCRALPVKGGTFYRTFDELGGKSDVATVSDLVMDRFEVTVGRFRKFVTAWIGGYRPTAGAGLHSHLNDGKGLVVGAGFEPGWAVAWAAQLPASATAWNTALACDASATWTDTEPSNARSDDRPINCVTWYEATAFAIWEGGFLPTELEWMNAAAGGTAQRLLPWSRPATSLVSDCSYANYQGAAGGKDCTGSPNVVGSYSPKGDTLFGQADMAGNVSEWVLDWYDYPYTSPCNDCTAASSTVGRVTVSGDFRIPLDSITTASRDGTNADVRSPFIGFRVASPR